MTSTVTRQNSALNINLSTSTDLTPKQGFGSQPLWHPTSRDHTSKNTLKDGIPPEFPHEWFHTSTSRNRPRSGQTGQKSLTVSSYPVMSSIQHPYAQLSLWLTAAESPFISIIGYLNMALTITEWSCTVLFGCVIIFSTVLHPVDSYLYNNRYVG